MNDNDRADWVMNDEILYRWWKQTKGSIRDFVRENRQELTRYIEGRKNA